MQETIYITKASGELSPFSEEKIRKSLRRSGADEDQMDFILREIAARLYEGMPTKQIYRIAYKLLKEGSRHLAARYHLKQAIMELGPSGFPFEKYIAEIMRRQGYSAKTGQIMQGQCVSHEIDILAEKGNDLLLIECKYHNYAGIICNVRIPLYIHARFMDVQKQWLLDPAYRDKSHHCRVVTNTRFSVDAIQYAGCAGMQLLGWDYPTKGSLKDQIDTLGLYPITCLTSLTKAEKQRLLDRHIVLCIELNDNEKILEAIGIKRARTAVVLNEAHQLCRDLTENTVSGRKHSSKHRTQS